MEKNIFADSKNLSLIKEYIRSARSKGYADSLIINALKKAGWKDAQISYALESLANETTKYQKADETARQPAAKPPKSAPETFKPAFKKIEKKQGEYSMTGVSGLDTLLEKGIPTGTSIIIAGGPGSGKTILCLQIAKNAAERGERVLYISLEEKPDRLKKHMADFGWDANSYENKGLLEIMRVDPFFISRQVEGMLAKAKGELIMDVVYLGNLLPKAFEPKWVILDSITALESAFKEEQDSYRIYIEQLFRYFEKLGVNLLLVSETENVPKVYSKKGVEEFLADGVIVLYHIKRKNARERAIEILKLRGAEHKSQIVAMQIKAGEGIKIYPEQEVFGEIE